MGQGSDARPDSGGEERRASQSEAREKARLTNGTAVLDTAIRGGRGVIHAAPLPGPTVGSHLQLWQPDGSFCVSCLVTEACQRPRLGPLYISSFNPKNSSVTQGGRWQIPNLKMGKLKLR